ncbi:DNA-binding protein, partial [Dysosmobacter welbionis]
QCCPVPDPHLLDGSSAFIPVHGFIALRHPAHLPGHTGSLVRHHAFRHGQQGLGVAKIRGPQHKEVSRLVLPGQQDCPLRLEEVCLVPLHSDGGVVFPRVRGSVHIGSYLSRLRRVDGKPQPCAGPRLIVPPIARALLGTHVRQH